MACTRAPLARVGLAAIPGAGPPGRGPSAALLLLRLPASRPVFLPGLGGGAGPGTLWGGLTLTRTACDLLRLSAWPGVRSRPPGGAETVYPEEGGGGGQLPGCSGLPAPRRRRCDRERSRTFERHECRIHFHVVRESPGRCDSEGIPQGVKSETSRSKVSRAHRFPGRCRWIPPTGPPRPRPRRGRPRVP